MLRVHFLNVGHGDCTIIEHPSGRLTMVDINNSQSYDDETKRALVLDEIARRAPAIPVYGSVPWYTQPFLAPEPRLTALFEVEARAKRELTDPVEYMQRNLRGRRLFRFVLTHPDLDHMRGLRRLHDTIGFDSFWDTANAKPRPSYRSEGDRTDWEFYQALRSDHRCRFYTRGLSLFAFGKDENGYPGEITSRSSRRTRRSSAPATRPGFPTTSASSYAFTTPDAPSSCRGTSRSWPGTTW